MMLEPLIFGVDIHKFVGNYFNVVLAMIVFDILTGLLVGAKERKINSSINYDGLIRKVGLMVGFVFVTFVDYYLQMDGWIIKVGVGLLIVYEGLSIIENFSRIGVNLNFLTQYFDPKKVGKGEDEK